MGKLIAVLLLFWSSSPLWAQGVLENPQPGSFQSGIGVVSGWVCRAEQVLLVFDSALVLEAAYGTSREDTRGVCGDAQNGFGLLINWNLLGDGVHRVEALADGVPFGAATFTVTTLGVEFLRGARGSCTIRDFPQSGRNTTLRWQESLQNFVLERVEFAVPQVAGLWRLEVRFLSEDCNFLSVPPDLPTEIRTLVRVDQDGASLSATAGELELSGEVEPSGDFTLVSEPTVDTVSGCTFGIALGIGGNFLEGAAVVVLLVDRIRGVCVGLSLPCSVNYGGTILRVSSSRAFSAPAEARGGVSLEGVLRGVLELLRR